jgi:hypothetical protein
MLYGRVEIEKQDFSLLYSPRARRHGDLGAEHILPESSLAIGLRKRKV